MILGADGVDIVAHQGTLSSRQNFVRGDTSPTPVDAPNRTRSAFLQPSTTAVRNEGSLEVGSQGAPVNAEVEDTASQTEVSAPEVSAWVSTSEVAALQEVSGASQEKMLARPPLYGILAALGASVGYAVLMVARCKGFLNELAPKAPLSGFMRSHLEKSNWANGEPRRKNRRGAAKFCGGATSLKVVGVSEQNVGIGGVHPDPP